MAKERSKKQKAAAKKLGDAAKLKAARKVIAELEKDAENEKALADIAASEEINRTARSAETREKTTRRKPWEPPSMLEAPPPPAGFHHHWIRAELIGEADKINMSKQMRQGYEVVRGDEYPDFELPTIEDGKHAGVISVGGLILARIPIETKKERDAYYSRLTQNQMAAIDNELKGHSQTIMPIEAPVRSTRTEFGNPDKDMD